MGVFIPCCDTAAVVDKAAVAAEVFVVEAVKGAVVAAAVFVEYAPAEVAAVVFGLTAYAYHSAPSVDFIIAVNVVFSAVSVYGGKGFYSVFAVAA